MNVNPEHGPEVDWASAYTYLEQELEEVLLRVADRMERLEAEVEAGRDAIRSVTLEQLASGQLRSVIVADGVDLRFAFYVYRDDVVVRREAYGRSNTLQWTPDRSGAYRVRGFIRRGTETEPAATRGSTTLTVDVP